MKDTKVSSGYIRFLLLWMGQFVSSVGGGLTSFGLTVYVFSKTGSATYTSMIALLAFFPNLLIGVPAGVISDRMDRRILMMLGDGLSATGLIYILFCLREENLLIWQIYLGVAISSTFSAFTEPAYKATVSDLLTKDEYIKASGMISIASSARYLISPFLAGILLSVSEIDLLLIIDICTFFLTVATTVIVKKNIRISNKNIESSFQEDMLVGFKVVSSNKGVLTLAVMAALITFCIGTMQILAEPMVLAIQDSKVLGIVETISALGMLVTGILLGVRGMKKRFVLVLCTSLVGAGVFMFFFSLIENLFMIGFFGFAFFAMIPIATSSLDYLVRTNINNEFQGRVWGLISFISQLGYVFSYAFCGVLADFYAKENSISIGRGSAAIIRIAGILLILLSFILYMLKDIRQLEKNATSEFEEMVMQKTRGETL